MLSARSSGFDPDVRRDASHGAVAGSNPWIPHDGDSSSTSSATPWTQQIQLQTLPARVPGYVDCQLPAEFSQASVALSWRHCSGDVRRGGVFSGSPVSPSDTGEAGRPIESGAPDPGS